MIEGWTKIPKGRSGNAGRNRRTKPAVMRNPNTPNTAYLSIPDGIVAGERASVFISGNAVGFLFGDDGEFVVRESDKRTGIRRMNIPSAVVHVVPFGVHEVDFLDGPDGMKVIDFDTIKPQTQEE